MRDFSKCKLSNIRYGGSERKLGIICDGSKCIIKFQKTDPFNKRYNHISEYIGSKIYSILGYDAQDVELGIYKNEYVVCCKDFNINGYTYVPFNDIGESTIETDKEKYTYSYEDILTLLSKNKKIVNIDETISLFFEMFIVDALIGNFDRHGSNWGFLKKDNLYKLAPIFDNGSSLFPMLVDDEQLLNVLNSSEEMDKRIYTFPTSQIKHKGKKSSYFEIINSLKYEQVNKALCVVYNKIDFMKINKLIETIDIISDTRKKFYKEMLKARYEKIIKASYDKLMEKANGK